MYLVKSSKWNGTGLCWSIHTFTTWSRLAPVRSLPSNRQMISNAPRFPCFQIASLVLSVPSYCASFHTLSLSFPPSFHEECHYPSTIPAIHFASRPSSARSSWRSISRHPSGTSWQSLELERLCTMWACGLSECLENNIKNTLWLFDWCSSDSLWHFVPPFNTMTQFLSLFVWSLHKRSKLNMKVQSAAERPVLRAHHGHCQMPWKTTVVDLVHLFKFGTSTYVEICRNENKHKAS